MNYKFRFISSCIICLIYSSVLYSFDSLKVEEYLKKYFNDNEPGGAVLVMKEGKVLFNKSYGLADLKKSKSNSLESLYYIASLSKFYTGVGIMKLYESGKLKFEDEISLYITSLSDNFKNVRIKHLLNHSSGIPEYFDSIEKKEGLTNYDVMQFLKNSELKFKPGEKFDYSNSNYIILSEIIEKVSLTSYQEFLSEVFFKKLDMENTFIQAEDILTITDISSGYSFHNNSFNEDNYKNFTTGSGGIFSGTNDLSKFISAFVGYKIVSKKTIDIAIKDNIKINAPQYPLRTEYSYGFLISNSPKHKFIFSMGGFAGYRSVFVVSLDEKLYVIVLFNSTKHDKYILTIPNDIGKIFLNE